MARLDAYIEYSMLLMLQHGVALYPTVTSLLILQPHHRVFTSQNASPTDLLSISRICSFVYFSLDLSFDRPKPLQMELLRLLEVVLEVELLVIVIKVASVVVRRS